MTAIDQIKDKIINHPLLLQYLVTAEVLVDISGDEPSDKENLTFDETDPNLAYFNYNKNDEDKTVELTGLKYEMYEDEDGEEYGSFYDTHGINDVNVPNTLGGYDVILIA